MKTSENAYRMIVRSYGGPLALEREDFAMENPKPGRVTIRVRAIGCNFSDALIAAGQYQRRPPLPFAPGAEVAGEVVAVGEGVTRWTSGDRVMALVDYGGYASYLEVDAVRVYPLPTGLSDDEAAAFGIVYQSSYFGLVVRANLQAEETVLIHAAAGGVGLAAVQIGKALGARVIATAGSDEKLAFAREHGADIGISYRDPTWIQQVKDATEGRGADVIYDPVGGDIFDGSMKCIAWDGRLVVIGFASGRIPSAHMNRVLLKNIALVGLHWGAYYDHDPKKIRDVHEALCVLVEKNRIRPMVTATAPLEDAAQVLEDLHKRKTRGKVVLRP